MWFPVTLFLLVGVAVAINDHEHAWEMGNEYQYLVYSRTLAGLDKLKEQYTGIQLKGILTLQAKSPQTLQAKLSNPQSARIHKTLDNGPNSEIPEQMLEYNPIPMSGKPFEIKLKHGVIRDLLIDRDVPTWELNILKSLISQLQIDTQGENAIRSKSAQIPLENSSALFKATEDSVSGKCEVLYEIMPLPDDAYEDIPDKLPFPQLRGNGYYYDIRKTKNYEKCQQRQIYNYGLRDPMLNKGKYNKQNEILSQLSTTQMIISGKLKQFTIQSVISKNHISVRPQKTDPLLGNVHSILKLTLIKKSKISNPVLGPVESINLESTGNLLYMYNDPFSNSENRKIRQPSISKNSEQIRSSESSSASSRSDESSSEESLLDASLWQPKAALHMAPNIPLLPLFVGYKGKTIHKSDKIDVVEEAYKLISEVADEIFATPDTLEKYTILKHYMKTMNLGQLTKLNELVLKEANKQEEPLKTNIWYVLNDAIAQVGTGPALMIIENWLKNQKIEGVQAAKVISQIPKYVHQPTKEYIKKYYEMITEPLILQQKYLNISAPLALSELIYNSRSKFWPIRSLGPLSPKDDNDIVNSYIPYLTKQLKQGLMEQNNQKVHTYILALSLTGHSKIISIFEPYIEGTEPMSTYQRLIMVAYMSLRLEPYLIGPILYKLYLNSKEDHKIRCLAVGQYILTDPPLVMLQSMAKYTHTEVNDQVNSAIKTAIESLANTNQPEMQNLANKARLVKPLLNPKKYNKWNSKVYYKGLQDWLIKSLNLQTVIGDDSKIPQYLLLKLKTIYDLFGLPTLEVGYSASSIKQLYNALWGQYLKDEEISEESSQKSRVEKIVQALKIKPDNLNELEGDIIINTLYGLLYYPVDVYSMPQIPSQLTNILKKNQKRELTSYSSYEVTLSFPTESGMPFIYTLESPMLIKLKAELRNHESPGVKKSGILNAQIAKKDQKRFGFLAPFEYQHYVTGIDNNQILQIPLEYEIELDMQKNFGLNSLKLRPNSLQTRMDSPMKLLQVSTIPFTTRQDIHNLQPISLNKNTHLVMTSGKYKKMLEMDLISIDLESDEKETEENQIQNNVVQLLLKPQEFTGQYKKLDILMNPEQIAKSELYINTAYEKMAVDVNNDDSEQQSYEMQTIFPIKHFKPNSEKRRKEISLGLSKGFDSGNIYVLDISLNSPALREQQVLTFGMLNSILDRKSKNYFYWNSQSPKKDEPTREACYLQEIQNSPDTPLNLEYTLKHAPKDMLKIQFQYGNRCRKGPNIVVDVNATRSRQLKELLENSKIMKKCLEETKEMNEEKIRACQQAIEIAQVRNQYDISYDDVINLIIDKIKDYIEHLLPNSMMKITNREQFKTNTVNLRLIKPPSDIMSMVSPYMDATLFNRWKSSWKSEPLWTGNNMLQEEDKSKCIMDKNMIVTFDKMIYPVTLGACEHVLVTTYPQRNPYNYNRMTKPNMAILAMDEINDSKSISVLLGNHEIKLTKLDNKLEAALDGIPIDLSQKSHYRENGEIIFETMMLPDLSIEIISPKYGITVVYSGNSVQITVRDSYRNALRGLCGNFDSEPKTDLLTPQNCVLKIPEIFVATYALTQKNCQGPSLENYRKIEQAQCYERPLYYQNNVINDKEAGRILTQKENWGYHQINSRKEEQNQDIKTYSLEREDMSIDDRRKQNVVYRTKVVQENQRICYTTRPVPTCREGSRPVERKPKKYDLVCMPINEESVALKRRVEQGANPDLTQKLVSRSHIFEVPLRCRVV